MTATAKIATGNIHQIKHITKYGASETLRVYGAPDRDMAVAFVNRRCPGSNVLAAYTLAIAGEAEPEFSWGEMVLGNWEA